MTRDDWFRQTHWTPEAERDFEARLARSRGQRGEYLRIQALTLADTRDPANARPALDLAQRFLAENPSDFRRAGALVTVARTYAILGEPDAAVEAYLEAAEAERTTRQMRFRAYLDLAWFVATNGLSQHYDEALAAMEAGMQPDDLVFPLTRYWYFGSLALISADRGDMEHARAMARNAVAAIHQPGPFERHPDVGVVSAVADVARDRLVALTG